MYIYQQYSFVFLVCFVLLTACSGGGSEPSPGNNDTDSSSGDPLPDVPGLPNLYPNPSDSGSPITVDNPLTGSVVKGGQQNYAFTATAGTTYTVTVTPSSGVAYLRVFLNNDQVASSLTQYENSVTFTPESTASYTFSIRGFTDAQFQIHVGEGLGNTSLWISQSTITLYGTKGSEIPSPVDIDVYHPDGELRIDSAPDWLTLDTQPGDQASYEKLSITPNDTALSRNTDILVHLVRDGIIVAEKQLQINYVLRIAMAVYSDQFQVLSETSHASFTASNNEIIDRFEVNRFTTKEDYDAQNQSLDWTAVSNQSWLVVQTLCACNNGGKNDEIYFTIKDYSGLAAGKHTATITLTDTVTGHQVLFTVILNLDDNKLSAARNGIALMVSASESRLSQTIGVSNTANANITWQASTNTPSWLVATANNTDNTVTITANPEALAAETVHYAQVTLSSSQTTNQDVIDVGFYVTANITDDTNIISFNSKNYFCRCQRMVADPVRPYVYIQNFGPKILIFNIYTSDRVGEYDIATALGRDFKSNDIEISSNGERLFVREQDTANVVAIDLNSGVINPPWNLNTTQNAYNAGQLKYARVDGKPVLLTYLVSTNGTWRSSTIAAYDAQNGVLLADHSDTVINDAYKLLEATPLSNYLAIGEYDNTIQSIVTYKMNYSDTDQSFTFKRFNTRSSFITPYDDFALLSNAPELYSINSVLTKYLGLGFAEEVHELANGSSSFNLIADHDDTVYALMTAQVDNATNYWLLKYNADTGAIVESPTVSNTYRARETQSRLSGDEQRVMSLGFTGGSPSSSDGQEVIWFIDSE